MKWSGGKKVTRSALTVVTSVVVSFVVYLILGILILLGDGKPSGSGGGFN